MDKEGNGIPPGVKVSRIYTICHGLSVLSAFKTSGVATTCILTICRRLQYFYSGRDGRIVCAKVVKNCG